MTDDIKELPGADANQGVRDADGNVELQGTLGVPLLIGEKEITALAEAFAIGRKGRAYTEEEFEAIVFWASDAVFRHKMFRAVVEGVVNMDITENGELFFDLNREAEEAAADGNTA